MRNRIITIFTVLVLSACSNQPQDKFIGKWNYSGNGKLMTVPLKCSIDLEISKSTGSKVYILNTLKLHLSPAVFGMNGGEFFNNVQLQIKDDTTMITPALPSGSNMAITLKDTNQIVLSPNPCNGITSDGLLDKVK